MPHLPSLMLVALGHTCPLHGLDINVNAAWEEQGILPSHASPILPGRLTLKVKPRQFMQNSTTAKPTQSCGILPWEWTDRQVNTSPQRKFTPQWGEVQKISLILAGERPLQLQLSCSLFVCLTCSERMNVFASPWNPVTVMLDV